MELLQCLDLEYFNMFAGSTCCLRNKNYWEVEEQVGLGLSM